MDKSKLMMFIIIGLLVLLLGTVVGVTVYLIGLVGDDRPEEFQVEQEAPPPPNLSLRDLDEFNLGDFLTNLAVDPDGRSAVVITEVVLGINNTGDVTELSEFMDILEASRHLARGHVNDVFGNLTYGEVRTPEGRAAAGEEIRLRLQSAFESNLIIVVGFSDWMLQRN